MNVDYNILIVDEACQCVETSIIIPLSSFSIKKVVMVGEQMQLPPTVLSQQNKKNKYSKSLFEHLVDYNNKIVMLNTQYRMHATIRKYIGEEFYQNKIEDNEVAKDNEIFHYINEKHNFSYLNLSYSKERADAFKSYSNAEECEFIVSLLNMKDSSLEIIQTRIIVIRSFIVILSIVFRLLVLIMRKYC